MKVQRGKHNDNNILSDNETDSDIDKTPLGTPHSYAACVGIREYHRFGECVASDAVVCSDGDAALSLNFASGGRCRMVFGILAFTIFDYSTQFAETDMRLLMRQTDHPLVMAGPLFQPVRGFLFGIAFFLLRKVLFGKKYGWLTMWTVLVIIGILSTFGPSPGSIEGMVYSLSQRDAASTGQARFW